MPSIDKSVARLNEPVFHALQNIKDPKALTEADAQEIRKAVLADGTVDEAERDLIDELSQNSGSITVSGGESGGTLTLGVAQGKAKAALNISMWDVLGRKAEIKKEDVAEGWTNFKTWANEHVFQYDPSQGTKSENQANCGPASAAMMGERLGIEMPKLNALRRLVGARLGIGEGAFALSKEQVAEAVVKQGARQGVKVTSKIENLTQMSRNPDQLLNHLKSRLDAGEKIILLTSNIVVQDRNSMRGKGHYVVLEAVQPDGSIVVDDPQKPAERGGQNRVHTKQELATAMWRRRNLFSADTSIITFKEVAPKAPAK